MRFFIAIASLLFVSSTSASYSQLPSDDPISHYNELTKGYKGEEAGPYSHGFTLECDYAVVRHYWGEMYTCITRNLVTRHHYDYVVKATGDHVTGKTDRDVKAIFILGQRTPFIPYNLTTPFGDSVVALRVENSGLRWLNRTWAYEGKLEYMHFENNMIEEVPTWAFRNMTELKWLSFRNNYIRYLEGTVLHGMTKLQRFSVSNNRIEVLPSGLFHDNGALEMVYFYNNRIRMVGWKLFSYIRGLKVAAFKGNPCTEMSIYDGGNMVERFSAEFKSKCAVDCRRAQAAGEKLKEELKKDLRAVEMCDMGQPRLYNDGETDSDSSSEEQNRANADSNESSSRQRNNNLRRRGPIIIVNH